MTPADPALPPPILDKDDIVNHLSEVGEELAARDIACTMVIVGGSYLALYDLRESTADVDSMTRLSDEVKAAIREVATRHGLRPNWLNDSAAMFAPAGLHLDECEIRYRTSHLTILAPPPDTVFLMKLLAARAPDHDDMVALWPRCHFTDAQAAVDAFTPPIRSRSTIRTSSTTCSRSRTNPDPSTGPGPPEAPGPMRGRRSAGRELSQ